jgi:hypothetical protein
MKRIFVPTHRMKHGGVARQLPAGTLVRKSNPFGHDIHHCYSQEDYDNNCWQPWLLTDGDIEPLETWPTIRQEMIDAIAEKAGWNRPKSPK